MRAGGWLAGLTVAAVLLYANALANPFLSDDEPIIARNSIITRPTVAGLRQLWTAGYWQTLGADGRLIWLSEEDRNLYRPVTIASFWIGARVGGVGPARFRLVNVLVHALAAWAVGLWCARWYGGYAGLVASLVVLLHPIATDVVNRIVGRADLLVVAASAGFLAVQRGAHVFGWSWARAGLAALLAMAALGSKESGVVLLPVALVQAWLGQQTRGLASGAHGAGGCAAVEDTSPPTDAGASSDPAHAQHDTRSSDEHASMSRGGRHAWRGAFAVAFAVALYLAGRSVATELPRYAALWDLTGNPLIGQPLAARLPASLALAAYYARLLVFPRPLMAFDFPARVPGWGDPETLIGLTLLLLLCGLGLVLLRRRHPAVLAVAWAIAVFALVSHLVVALATYREVRLAYVMLGALGFGIGALVRRPFLRTPAARRVAVVGAVLLAVAAAVAVVSRNAESRSNLALAEVDARRRPGSAAAFLKLGGAYEQAGRMQEAEAAFTKATVLAPAAAEGWFQLGEFRAAYGRLADAEALFAKALAADPDHPIILLRLATIALDKDDLATAEGLLARAERAAPDDPFVAYNLAVVDEHRGRLDHAITRLEALVARRPDFARGRQGLAALREARARQSRGAH